MDKYTGPSAWAKWSKLHQIALDVRSKEEKGDFIKYCDAVVKIHGKSMNNLPIDEPESNEKNELVSWSWKMHEMVNEKIYKNFGLCNSDDNDNDSDDNDGNDSDD